ncbi:MAG: LysR family transcriptional regulator [Bradyrhizobium sp.]|jgi:DNA-binding transcriptional LysR family regulator|uniref:LysR family transcriptional regulator n=1 Tax=Bradyrhizobium sp. TaxID=376 RepID=UPI001217B431|nr:LysR family transcriptional regulator [Bradyrhizobium sp.]THD52346.1 MAG: LysR family transcriptional regulator [Bradyrhizobium sp.]
MQDLNWNDLRYVLAIARSGGAHGPAGRLLGVNETTVSRRLARIEAILGSKLFQRSEGSLRLTDVGHRVVERAERIELEVEAVKEMTGGTKSAVAGHVRLTSIPVLINRLLFPDLKRLYKAHPDLRVEFIAEPRNLSLTKRDADLALRFARPDREQRVIARRIAQLKYAVYGPSGRKASPLPWITYEDRMLGLPHAAWLHQAVRADGGVASVVVNDSELALHAVKAGLGKSLLPTFVGETEKGLSKLSGGEAVLERELWLLVHPELKHLARVKAVIAWIEAVVRGRVRT